MKRFLAAAVLALSACAPHAPQLVPPETVDSYCSEKEPRGTAIASILSSAADRDLQLPFPGDAVLRKSIKAHGGVIGRWVTHPQPLYMPNLAAKLGLTNTYIDVVAVYIDNQLEASDSRFIYASVKTPAGVKSLVLRAYDTQNVCVEGTRLS